MTVHFAGSPPSPTPGDHCARFTHLANTDVQDGFGAPVHGTSDECCAQCLAMAGCRGFATTGGVCYFKNGTTTLPKPGVDTYLMRSSGELVEAAVPPRSDHALLP